MRKAVAEWNNGEWLLMLPDGSVKCCANPHQVARAVHSNARKERRSIVLTELEWRNAPRGFVPPETVA